MGKKFTRIFLATDTHGSERCFRKCLAAAKFYKSDILVLDGDVTGKLVITIVDMGDGTFKTDYQGKEMVVRTPDEIKRLERLISDSGYYYYHCGKSEMDDLRASKTNIAYAYLRYSNFLIDIQWARLGVCATGYVGACRLPML